MQLQHGSHATTSPCADAAWCYLFFSWKIKGDAKASLTAPRFEFLPLGVRFTSSVRRGDLRISGHHRSTLVTRLRKPLLLPGFSASDGGALLLPGAAVFFCPQGRPGAAGSAQSCRPSPPVSRADTPSGSASAGCKLIHFMKFTGRDRVAGPSGSDHRPARAEVVEPPADVQQILDVDRLAVDRHHRSRTRADLAVGQFRGAGDDDDLAAGIARFRQ